MENRMLQIFEEVSQTIPNQPKIQYQRHQLTSHSFDKLTIQTCDTQQVSEVILSPTDIARLQGFTLNNGAYLHAGLLPTGYLRIQEIEALGISLLPLGNTPAPEINPSILSFMRMQTALSKLLTAKAALNKSPEAEKTPMIMEPAVLPIQKPVELYVGAAAPDTYFLPHKKSVVPNNKKVVLAQPVNPLPVKPLTVPVASRVRIANHRRTYAMIPAETLDSSRTALPLVPKKYFTPSDVAMLKDHSVRTKQRSINAMAHLNAPSASSTPSAPLPYIKSWSNFPPVYNQILDTMSTSISTLEGKDKRDALNIISILKDAKLSPHQKIQTIISDALRPREDDAKSCFANFFSPSPGKTIGRKILDEIMSLENKEINEKTAKKFERNINLLLSEVKPTKLFAQRADTKRSNRVASI